MLCYWWELGPKSSYSHFTEPIARGDGMQTTLIRILKHGIPAAVILAVIGYAMSEFAGGWISAQPDPRRNDPTSKNAPEFTGEEIARTMKMKLPLTMATWGFGIVVVFELIAWVWRPASQSGPRPAGMPKESEVELLLNQLLIRAEADKIARERSGQSPNHSRGDNGTESHSELDLGNQSQ